MSAEARFCEHAADECPQACPCATGCYCRERTWTADPDGNPVPDQPKQKVGFALLSPERRREIASSGGRSTWSRGHARHFTSEEASAAGRKSHEDGKAYRFTSEGAKAAAAKSAEARRSNKTKTGEGT